MRKIFTVLSILLVLGLGGLGFFLYQSLDEENYRKQVIQATRDLFGREMVVSGKTSISLFPSPVITLNDVHVTNKNGMPSKELLSVGKVRASVKWESLFKNPLVVENIILEKPHLFLERNKKGENNWDFPFLAESTKEGQKDILIGTQISGRSPQFEKIIIKDGLFSYTNEATGFSKTLSNLNGELSARSISGPFNFQGTGSFDKMNVEMAMSMEKISAALTSRISLNLKDTGSDALLKVDGTLKDIMRNTILDGTATFNIPKLALFLLDAYDYRGLPSSIDNSVVGTVSFEFSKEKANFKDLAFRYGNNDIENAVTGTLSMLYPDAAYSNMRVNGTFLTDQVNLDTFYPIVPSLEDWKTKIASWNRNLKSDINLTIDAKTIMFKKQPVKSTTLEVAYNNGLIEIKSFKTLLPGETTLTAQGDIAVVENKPVAKINLSLNTPNLSKTMTWLDKKLPYFEISSVSDMKANTFMTLRPQDLTFSKIDISSMGGKVTGDIAIALDEKKARSVMDLAFENINLDSYFPYKQPDEERSIYETLEDFTKTVETSSLFTDLNFDLKAQGTNITFRDVPIRKATYVGKLVNGLWTTNDLDFKDAAGANFRFSGQIERTAENKVNFNDLSYSLNALKPSLLFKRLKIKSPLEEEMSKLSLEGVASGTLDNLDIDFKTSFSQTSLHVAGEVKDLTRKDPVYALSVSLTHPDFNQFVKMFDKSFNKLPKMTGTFAFDLGFEGTSKIFKLSQISGSIGNQTFKGDLNVNATADVKINGHLTSSQFYMDKIIPEDKIFAIQNPTVKKVKFSGQLLNLSALDGLDMDLGITANKASYGTLNIDAFNTHFAVKEKVLTIDKLTGKLGEGNLSATGQLNATSAEPSVKFNIIASDVPLSPNALALDTYRVKSGTGEFTAEGTAKGNSFKDMMTTLSATGHYKIKNGTLSGLNLGQFERAVQAFVMKGNDRQDLDQRLQRDLSYGETNFDDISGTYAINGGILRTSDFIMRTGQSTALMQMSFNIPEWLVSSSAGITLDSFPGFPAISVLVKGAADAPQSEVDLSAFMRHLDKTSAQARDEMAQQKKEEAYQKMKEETKNRKAQLMIMLGSAREALEQASAAMKLAPMASAEPNLIRAKDALALLEELSLKASPTEADMERAQEQSALAVSRANAVEREVSIAAVSALHEKISATYKQVQEKMTAIHRVKQRLSGVDSVDAAYKRGFGLMTLMQQIQEYTEKNNDLKMLLTAAQKSEETLNLITQTYNEISKFDLESGEAVAETPNQTVRGTIRRRGQE